MKIKMSPSIHPYFNFSQPLSLLSLPPPAYVLSPSVCPSVPLSSLPTPPPSLPPPSHTLLGYPQRPPWSQERAPLVPETEHRASLLRAPSGCCQGTSTLHTHTAHCLSPDRDGENLGLLYPLYGHVCSLMSRICIMCVHM